MIQFGFYMSRPASYPLRIPDTTRDYLEEQAKENNRSLQGELLTRIQVTMDIERLYKNQMGSLDELVTRLSKLLTAEKKLDKNFEDITKLKEQLEEKNELIQKLISTSHTGLEDKKKNITRISFQLENVLNEFHQLFPSEQSK
ncbi:Arc family DNA-binding protein [Photobacterium iliopiscarium]|uniref:Arc family DNA-binding protein n=1 Tax=Photobacterium iliopiscarium TaxID=56192 RepID=UPI00242CA9C7|nr:Arc family DNA-binding protein [Photobacterium iliopiscarium]